MGMGEVVLGWGREEEGWREEVEVEMVVVRRGSATGEEERGEEERGDVARGTGRVDV